MILQVIVDRLDLKKEGITKNFGETFEVSEDRAKEILNYKFNGKAVAVPFFYGDKELEMKVKTLETEKEELTKENDTLKAENEELLKKIETFENNKSESENNLDNEDDSDKELENNSENKEDSEEEKEIKNKKGGKKDE